MAEPFSVTTSSRFDRLAKALRKRHPQHFTDVLREAIEILARDPHNHSRRYSIKKLVGMGPGEGQYRLRLGRFRFRYDISGASVILMRCSLRREDTYER